MIVSLKGDIEKHGDRAAIIPIERLQDIGQDVEDLKGRGGLNNFQQYIVNNLYSLSIPDASFEIRSIIIVASPSLASVKTIFHWQGKTLSSMLPASYVDKNQSPVRIERYLKEFLNPQGYHVLYAAQLPRKLSAVRSGLAVYGRNNITYVEGMGSFLNLNPYFSDIPCQDDTWHEIRQMELCRTCQACLQNCPTGAIMPVRFLIDNERCLTYFNEAGGEWNFPDWIDPAAHHTLYGCMRCQAACPANKPYLKEQAEPLVFSEEETAYLLEGRPFELFPEPLKQKVDQLDMHEYLSALPRNLRALMNSTL